MVSVARTGIQYETREGIGSWSGSRGTCFGDFTPRFILLSFICAQVALCLPSSLRI